MKRTVVTFLAWAILSSLPVFGQEKLYPVTGAKDSLVVLTPDHLGVVAERAFQHKLTLAFPTDDKISFVPNTGEGMVVLWLRIQNISQRPLDFDITKFTGTDDQGRMYSLITPDEATKRIIAEGSGPTV